MYCLKKQWKTKKKLIKPAWGIDRKDGVGTGVRLPHCIPFHFSILKISTLKECKIYSLTLSGK